MDTLDVMIGVGFALFAVGCAVVVWLGLNRIMAEDAELDEYEDWRKRNDS